MAIRNLFEYLRDRISRYDTAVARGILALLQLASLAMFAGPSYAIDGLPLDDAWIHQVVARTFANSGTLGYAPGHHGAAATSFLWAALLAVNFRFVHAQAVAFTLGLNIVLSLAVGQCLFSIFIEAWPKGTHAIYRSAATLGIAALACAGGNFIWFAYSGMEATLFCALTTSAIAFGCLPSRRPALSAIASGMCLGALALSRPEAIPLSLLIVLGGFLARRSFRDTVLMAVPWALASAVYFGSNWLATQTPIPATLNGRKWLWLGVTVGLPKFMVVLEFIDAWIWRLKDYTLGTSSWVAFWVGSGLAAYGVFRVARDKYYGALVLVVVAVAHFITYTVILPSPGQGGRYQPLTNLLWLLFVGYGSILILDELSEPLPRMVRPWAKGAQVPLALAAWVALVLVGVRDWSGDHAMAVSHIRRTEIGMGAVVDSLPEDARVGAFDIGGVGFASHRPIFDLGGLVDRDAATKMIEGRTWEYVLEQKLDYVILSAAYLEWMPEAINIGYRLRMFDNPAVELEPVRVLESPPEVWLPSIRSTWNSAPKQVLFRIHPTGLAGPPPIGLSRPGLPLVDRDGLLDRRKRLVLQRAADVLAGCDIPVQIVVSGAEPASARDEATWLIAIGAHAVEARPSARSHVPPAALEALVTQWATPYLHVEDWAGASLSALHATARAIRHWDNPAFLPMLPTLSPPLYKGGYNDAEGTAAWGLPVVLGILGAAMALLRWRERRARSRGDRTPTSRGLAVAAPLAGMMVLLGCGSADDFGRSLSFGEEVGVRRVAVLADVNVTNANGWTPLGLAADRGFAEVTTALLKRGAKVDALDPRGVTALEIASRSGHDGAVEVLLAAGADPNIVDGILHETSLHVAVRGGFVEVVKMLLARGANPNLANVWGETPLHLVSCDPWRSAQLAPALWAAGANSRTQDLRGFAPIHAAVTCDNFTYVHLANGDEINDLTPAGMTALDLALEGRNDRAAQELILKGAVAGWTRTWLPPLHTAARMDDAPRIVRLLSAGVADAPFQGKTAYRRAQEEGSTRALALLRPGSPSQR